MEFLIPKKFKIFDSEYTVKQVKQVDAEDSMGEHDYETRVVKLKKSLIDNEKEKIFFHEAIHCILEHLGYDKLSNDEKLVHQMASAIHQIIKTSK